MRVIKVAQDFTRFPSGRFKKNGDTSGEAFREKFLEPALKDGIEITVDLDGTIGYGSSFLEEAFGGLIRALRIKPEHLRNRLHLASSDPSLIEEIESYIADAGKNLAE